MNREHRLEIKVGLFVLGAVALGLFLIVLLGRSRHVFEQRASLHAYFAEVGGLVQGAPVRVAGVNVGTVSEIMFVRSTPRPRIRVEMQIKESALGLIRVDSRARISAQGLLGDKIIELSVGSTSAPWVGRDGEVQSATAPDFDRMLQQAATVIDDAAKVATRAAAAVDQFADAKLIGEIRESVVHIHSLLHATDKGGGLAHALFYDERTSDALQEIEQNLARLSGRLDRSAQQLERVLATTDGDGRQLLNNVSRAALSVGKTADRLERSPLLGNLERASGDLAQMTGYAKSGQGTLGALLVDPTVYEQLVQVLGGVARSRILRALVRYAISRDEGHDRARLISPAPANAAERSEKSERK